MVRVLLNVPKQVRRGETFEVKLLISHPMESGQRRDAVGLLIPRDIIHRLDCAFAGESVLQADFFPAIAANPFLAFSVLAERGGTLSVSFTDDHGVTQTETTEVEVV